MTSKVALLVLFSAVVCFAEAYYYDYYYPYGGYRYDPYYYGGYGYGYPYYGGNGYGYEYPYYAPGRGRGRSRGAVRRTSSSARPADDDQDDVGLQPTNQERGSQYQAYDPDDEPPQPVGPPQPSERSRELRSPPERTSRPTSGGNPPGAAYSHRRRHRRYRGGARVIDHGMWGASDNIDAFLG